MLLSPEEYVRLMDEVNDARLASTAPARLESFDSSDALSEEDVLRELGIGGDEVANADEAEIE